MSILILEPDSAYRRLLATAIASAGSELVEVGSIAETESFLLSGTITAMVTEWSLPDGCALSLIEHASRARTRGGRITCVVLAATASRDDVLAAVQAGSRGSC